MTTVKQWLQAELLDKQTQYATDNQLGWLKQIVQHGCVSGIINDLIAYEGTTAFYNKYETEIWEKLADECHQNGFDNIMALLAHFSGAQQVHNLAQFKNMLAWWIVEESASQLLTEQGE